MDLHQRKNLITFLGITTGFIVLFGLGFASGTLYAKHELLPALAATAIVVFTIFGFLLLKRKK